MINSARLLLGSAALILSFGTAASAQNILGPTAAADRNDALLDQIEDDAERDIGRFGNEGRPQGFSGSFALRGIATSGNSDNLDLGVGADMNYVWGPNGIELQLSYAYGETNGTQDEESFVYSLEYTRDFTPAVFGFAKLQGSTDAFGEFADDNFLSFGAGYRIYNTPTMQWSVQAGPGYRVSSLRSAVEGIDEAAFGISSDYSHKLTNTLYVTNDTDVIYSDSDTVVFNDLALSVAMTDTLALRTSLLTEYHDNVGPGVENTDHTFGVSLVYSFN